MARIGQASRLLPSLPTPAGLFQGETRCRTRTTLTDFARNERGSVAILFGFCALVLVFVIGVAIDQARVYQSNSKIAAAADAAALAAAGH